MPAVRPGVRGAVITGWGTALPPKILTNVDLEQMMDTSDEWITERTGIRQRHVGGTTADLSVESARQAIAMAGLEPHEIDGLILATTTPTEWCRPPRRRCRHELGLTCGAFDVNAACSGWVYALIAAHGMIAMGADKVLVIGTDTLARIVDWTDRNTAILFADGSGAVVHRSGRRARARCSPGTSTPMAAPNASSTANTTRKMQMDGREIFRRAVRAMVDSATQVDGRIAGVTADDIALVVPHQANTRIISAAIDRLGLSMDRTALVLDRTGQHVVGVRARWRWPTPSTPDRVSDGDLVLFVGFGAGMTAASAIIRWSPNAVEHARRNPTHDRRIDGASDGPDRARHGRISRHRPRHRAAVRRAGRPCRRHLQRQSPTRRLVRREV